jgi:hypothetical protein
LHFTQRYGDSDVHVLAALRRLAEGGNHFDQQLVIHHENLPPHARSARRKSKIEPLQAGLAVAHGPD